MTYHNMVPVATLEPPQMLIFPSVTRIIISVSSSNMTSICFGTKVNKRVGRCIYPTCECHSQVHCTGHCLDV
jgi:hypothetical protein